MRVSAIAAPAEFIAAEPVIETDIGQAVRLALIDTPDCMIFADAEFVRKIF